MPLVWEITHSDRTVNFRVAIWPVPAKQGGGPGRRFGL